MKLIQVYHTPSLKKLRAKIILNNKVYKVRCGQTIKGVTCNFDIIRVDFGEQLIELIQKPSNVKFQLSLNGIKFL